MVHAWVPGELLSKRDDVFQPRSIGKFTLALFVCSCQLTDYQVGNNQVPDAQAALQQLQSQVAALTESYNGLRAEAFKEWKTSLDDGITDTDFATYLTTNRQDVMSEQAQLMGATTQLTQLLSNLYGDDASELNTIRNRFTELLINQELTGYGTP
jgi:hypothetical protein